LASLLISPPELASEQTFTDTSEVLLDVSEQQRMSRLVGGYSRQIRLVNRMLDLRIFEMVKKKAIHICTTLGHDKTLNAWRRFRVETKHILTKDIAGTAVLFMKHLIDKTDILKDTELRNVARYDLSLCRTEANLSRYNAANPTARLELSDRALQGPFMTPVYACEEFPGGVTHLLNSGQHETTVPVDDETLLFYYNILNSHISVIKINNWIKSLISYCDGLTAIDDIYACIAAAEPSTDSSNLNDLNALVEQLAMIGAVVTGKEK
jgi:hypothetical protein